MGEFVMTRCRDCQEQSNFLLGVGMMDWSLEAVIPRTKGSVRLKLQDIVATHQITDCDYKHRMLACPRCDTLHNRFYVRVEYGEGRLYETVFRCGKCRRLLIEPHKPISDYRCSNCGSYSLDDGAMGNWD